MDPNYEVGVDRVVLYKPGIGSYAWPGVTDIQAVYDDEEPFAVYQDGAKKYVDFSRPEYDATITCYTYPDILDPVVIDYDDTEYHLSYRSLLPNDDYFIHFVYFATLAFEDYSWETLSDRVDLSSITFSMTSVGRETVDMIDYAAHYIVDSRSVDSEKLKNLENILYRRDGKDYNFPSPIEIRAILSKENAFQIMVDVDTGLNPLKQTSIYDLIGNLQIGLYSRHPNSRLQRSMLLPAGFYRMEG